MAQPATLDDGREFIASLSRPVEAGRTTLYATMRDEMALAPAFLAHYRAMGFDQFLIVDDDSQDGTSAYLAAQEDVCILTTTLGYGAPLTYRDPAGVVTEQRAGVYYKMALPHVLCPGEYVAYFDADEFLFLPPGVDNIREVIARLAAEGAASATCTLVEMFPADVAGLAGPMPASAADLRAAYPWFEPDPLVALQPGAHPRLLGKPKTAELFERYDISVEIERRGWHRLYMPSRVRKAQSFQKSPRHKTPIVLRNAESYLSGTHMTNRPPSGEILLCAAHYVFTAQFADKIARATAWGAHANGAQKYKYYARLLEAMQGVPDGFLSERSQKLEDVQQLVDCGLMKW